jgi:hypothetical protein
MVLRRIEKSKAIHVSEIFGIQDGNKFYADYGEKD